VNRGFLYGDGFFESIRVHQSEIPLAEFHLERIIQAIEILKIEPAFDINQEFLYNAIKPQDLSEARVRINFFRDGLGTYQPETNKLAFNMNISETTEGFFLPTGLNLREELSSAPVQPGEIAMNDEIKPRHPLYTIKSLSSAFYVLASLKKKELNADYLLLLNEQEQIIEELSSNLIMVKDDMIFTPPLDSGKVLGATLRFILKAYGFQLDFKSVDKNELIDMDEIYISKASTGLSRIR
jgi:branched-chain amino acid aminotransferase